MVFGDAIESHVSKQFHFTLLSKLDIHPVNAYCNFLFNGILCTMSYGCNVHLQIYLQARKYNGNQIKLSRWLDPDLPYVTLRQANVIRIWVSSFNIYIHVL